MSTPKARAKDFIPICRSIGNRDARIFAYWDHEPRMPWQTLAYYQSQKKTLRPGTYLRLHENKWASAEEVFITPEMWDPCVNPFPSPEHHRP